MAPFGDEFFGGQHELARTAATIFALVGQLEALAPDFAEEAPARVGFAINGVTTSDWSTQIPADAQVLLLPRIGGG